MKIAFISHSPHMFGAEKILINMAKRLQLDYNIEPYIFASGTGSMKLMAESNGLNYYSLDNSMPWYLFIDDDPNLIVQHFYELNKCTEELFKNLMGLGIDCVVINTLTGLSGMLAAAKLNIPSLLWVHGIIDHMLVPSSGSKFKIVCDRLLVQSATAVICPSNWIKDHYQYYRKDINVILNFTFVPDEPLTYPTGVSTFCCLNTWDHHKGIECLIHAAKILKEKDILYKINFYGDGLLKSKMNNLIETYKLGNYVFLKERVADISDIFSISHALVTASQIEPFGMTLIEAMAHARPIIVSETSGHKEILEDKKYGYFCNVNDPEGFAEKMEWIVNNHNEARIMGLEGYEKATKLYDGENSSEQMYFILRKIIGEKQTTNIVEQINDYIYCDLFTSLLELFLKYDDSHQLIGIVDHGNKCSNDRMLITKKIYVDNTIPYLAQ